MGFVANFGCRFGSAPLSFPRKLDREKRLSAGYCANR